MKKALLNTLQIILKTALAAVLFIMTWNWLTPYFRVNRNTDGDLFRNLPEDTIDVIALGSSHIQYAFNPAVFYAETGNYSYVLGSSCQPFSMSYYMLEEALKTQHPSVVVLDVFTLLPQSQVCYADGLYYKAIDMMSGDTRYEAGKYGTESLPENLQEAYTYDLILNHDHWKDMDFSDPDSIKANTPYIISMPNNENYDASYNITGNIQFIGNNVQIKASDNLSAVQSGNKSFVPNYQYQETSSSIYALNVNNQWNTNTSAEAEGSTFIRSLRAVRPFEAYLTVEGGTSAPNYIPVFGDVMPTGIDAKLVNSEGVNSEKWYSLDGRKLQGKPTKKGLYIVNGRKVVVK